MIWSTMENTFKNYWDEILRNNNKIPCPNCSSLCERNHLFGVWLCPKCDAKEIEEIKKWSIERRKM